MNKTIRVITSCETMSQFKSAEKYARLYNEQEENINNVIYVNDILLTKYKQLIKTL